MSDAKKESLIEHEMVLKKPKSRKNSLCDDIGRTRTVTRTLKSHHDKISKKYPQPPVKPVYYNRVVFGIGLATGLVIGLSLGMFLCLFLPKVWG